MDLPAQFLVGQNLLHRLLYRGRMIPILKSDQTSRMLEIINLMHFYNTTLVEVESSMDKYHLLNTPFIKDMKTVKDCCRNPITINTVQAQRAVQRIEKRAEITSASTLFQLSVTQTLCKVTGIFSFSDLFENGIFMAWRNSKYLETMFFFQTLQYKEKHQTFKC